MGIKKAILEVEYAKVGGKDIYDTVNKATQMQMQQQLPQIKEYIKNGGGAQGATATPAKNGTPLTPDEIAALKKDAVIEGNKNANILVIEYSDMECPFCMKQYHDTKLFEKVASQYANTVGLVFKNSRGVNHPGTEAKALGALCAQKLGGDAAYMKFYKAIMDGSTNE
jgi:protein-disulfide isomerase